MPRSMYALEDGVHLGVGGEDVHGAALVDRRRAGASENSEREISIAATVTRLDSG